jgi:hypothetical protein
VRGVSQGRGGCGQGAAEQSALWRVANVCGCSRDEQPEAIGEQVLELRCGGRGVAPLAAPVGHALPVRMHVRVIRAEVVACVLSQSDRWLIAELSRPASPQERTSRNSSSTMGPDSNPLLATSHVKAEHTMVSQEGPRNGIPAHCRSHSS